MPLINIHLQQLQFFAYHGLYEDEKKNGNQFELDVSLSFQQENDIVSHIDETIDYAAVYELIKAEMLQPRELLETFLGELAEKLKEKYPQITKIKLTLYKLTAPIAGLTGRVGVELLRNWST